MLPDLFKRLKPLYGHKIDVLWLDYQLADVERKIEIEQILTLLAVKRLGIAVGDERIVLEAPPAGVIGRGDYEVGLVEYPGLPGYPFRVGREELLRHMFILGPTGTGKSTLILGLLQQLLLDGKSMMVFDFKRNYRCLLDAPGAAALTVITVGRNVAPLRINALSPPSGVHVEEWVAGLADVISSSYLLMQGARNVLVEALVRAHREHGSDATLRDARRLLAAELLSLRAGSRRYGWLESSTRSLEELTKGGFGDALNSLAGVELSEMLSRPVVFELPGLGDDPTRFFCLFFLLSVLQYRKNDVSQREVLRHVLVFDEAHNVFPKDQFGEFGVPSRLAREVREYGEAIIAATQQADVAESLIANSGIKIILRTDYPKDVDFASRLLQVEPRWLAKLPLGTGIARLPTRYYNPFLFTFPTQPRKNMMVSDENVTARYEQRFGRTPEQPAPTTREAVNDEFFADEFSAKEDALLRDIAQFPIAGVTARYERLGWNARVGNDVKDHVISKGLATFESVATPTARVKILTLTDRGVQRLTRDGVDVPSWRRGGAAHEYWRAVVRSQLERAGYRVDEEHAIGGGSAVDLHGTKNGRDVFVEIETGKSDIAANIEKCVGLVGTVVFFFVTSDLRDAWREQLGTLPSVLAMTPSDLDRDGWGMGAALENHDAGTQ